MLFFSWNDFNAIVAQEVFKEVFHCSSAIKKKVFQQRVSSNVIVEYVYRVQQFFRVVYLKGTFRGLLYEPLIPIKLLIAPIRVVFKQREVSLFPGDFMDDYYEAGMKYGLIKPSENEF